MLVGESVITTLAAWELTSMACCPVATMGSGSMPKWTPPRTVKEVVIAADADDAGRKGAARLMRVLREKDIPARTIIPTIEGTDFADWLEVQHHNKNAIKC